MFFNKRVLFNKPIIFFNKLMTPFSNKYVVNNIIFTIVLLAFLGVFIWINNDEQASAIALVMVCGALGATIRELKSTTESKSHATNTIIINLLMGIILAMVLIVLLLSGLLKGDIFPKFRLDGGDNFISMYKTIRGGVIPENKTDFFKLILWSIIAGYSQKFVTSKLDSLTGNDNKSIHKNIKISRGETAVSASGVTANGDATANGGG